MSKCTSTSSKKSHFLYHSTSVPPYPIPPCLHTSTSAPPYLSSYLHTFLTLLTSIPSLPSLPPYLPYPPYLHTFLTLLTSISSLPSLPSIPSLPSLPPYLPYPPYLHTFLTFRPSSGEGTCVGIQMSNITDNPSYIVTSSAPPTDSGNVYDAVRVTYDPTAK